LRHVLDALWTLLLVIIRIFPAPNHASVDVSFLRWSMRMTTVFLILGTDLLGMLSGWGLVELIKKLFGRAPSARADVEIDRPHSVRKYLNDENVHLSCLPV